MVIAIRNGRIVGLNMPKERCGTEAEEAFLDKISSGTFEGGGHPVHLRLLGSFRLSERPYLYARHDELLWVKNAAEKYCITLDESFTKEFKELDKIFNEAKRKVFDEYYALKEKAIQEAEERKAKAEGKWAEMHKCEDNKCGNCPYCAEVIDGDLYCAKYKKYLDIEVAPAYDGLSGVHMMFASHGIKLAECLAVNKKEQEEEKARFIEEESQVRFWYPIKDAIRKEMRNY
jgi:hypothetical protein